MKSTERRREILRILQEQGELSAAEIAKRFGVSTMTGHRDLQHLEQRGLVRRRHGAAVAAHPLPGTEQPTGTRATAAPTTDAPCMICRRRPPPHLRYVLTLADGTNRVACCPHCGIFIHLVLGAQVVAAQALDYLTGQPVAADDAWFLLGSTAVPCCQPSILTFREQALALRFQVGFGGQPGRLSEAEEFLREEMHGAVASVPAGGRVDHGGRDPKPTAVEEAASTD